MRVLLLLAAACEAGAAPADPDASLLGPDASAVPGPDSSVDPAPDGPVAPAGVRERARALATHIAGSPRFLVGLGNDNSGPYDHGVPIDLHYAYLVGYGDGDGWPNWNEGGQYVDFFAQAADEHGAAPMFTYYQLALELELGNDAVFTDEDRMHQYLVDVRLLYQRLAAFGKPAIVTFEPDMFGYLENLARERGVAVADMPARLRYADVHECDALPETVAGFGRCVVAMGRSTAPEVRVGFHASMWGAWYDVTDPDADVEGSANQVAGFLREMGADDTDFVAIETLDRDAGFWETSGGGPTCSIEEGSRGAVYWDESNEGVPSFAQHLRWVGTITEALQRPALWWQTPLGVPSDQCGGTDGHWRDNRVHYFFGHLGELAAAGGVGAAFGTGAGGQTTLDTDGDQLKSAATAYRAAPYEL